MMERCLGHGATPGSNNTHVLLTCMPSLFANVSMYTSAITSTRNPLSDNTLLTRLVAQPPVLR